MKVIGAGLPRTGTLSQKVALEMLGFGPCYHMVNVLDGPAFDRTVVAGDGRRRRLGRDLRGARVDRRLARLVLLPRAGGCLPGREGGPERARSGSVGAEHARHDLGRALRRSPMAHISKAREIVDPEWHAYMELMRRMWAAQGVFSGAELRPGQLAEAITRYQEQVQRDDPRGTAARVERHRRVGAAVPVPRGRRAQRPVPAAQRQQDVHRPARRRVARGAPGVARGGSGARASARLTARNRVWEVTPDIRVTSPNGSGARREASGRERPVEPPQRQRDADRDDHAGTRAPSRARGGRAATTRSSAGLR